MRRLAVIVLGTILTVGCTPVEQSARNAAAGLKGAISSAQGQFQASCQSNPAQPVCGLINQAVWSQNALITSIEAYCSWDVNLPPAGSSKCVPVKSAEAAMITATQNANVLVLEIQAALKAGH